MNIEKISINKIKLASYNPRKDLKPGDEEYEKLKKSIEEFGFIEIPVLNKRNSVLISGHQRLKILKEKGIKEIEVVVVDYGPKKEKACNLALNKIRGGGWDLEKLASILDEMSQIPDFDITITGFDPPEISSTIDQYIETNEDEYDVQAEAESIEEPITQVGDVICLGEHRLLCGDCNKYEDLAKLMSENKAQILFTDPPYNVNYDSSTRPGQFDANNWDKISSDDMPQEDYEKWSEVNFANALSFMEPGASGYVWNGHKQFYSMHNMLISLGCHISSVITWAKDNFAPSYAPYNWQTEHCLFFWKSDGPHKWLGDNSQSNLWCISRDASSTLVHPTQKPVGLASKALKNSTKIGDIVLDIFGGSGSTILSAEQLGRKAYVIELDPKYCDGIVKRYISYVGKDKIDKETYEKYMEVKSEKPKAKKR